MKKYFILGSIIVSQTLTLRALEFDKLSLLNIPLEELKTIEVYTASRDLTKIEKAPSVVTVIDEDEIKKRGYRSLYDLLARIPGFFPAISGQAWELVSNRGFVQDQNINYLLLIDGHSQNTVTIHGMSNAHIFPTLDKVQRVEIIRGPSSTLWGSSANAGIIHIITKNAKQIDKDKKEYGSAQINTDYDFERERHVISSQYAKVFDRGDIMLSLTEFNSNADSADIYKPTENGIKHLDASLEPDWTSSTYSIWDHDPSHEIYLKASYDNFSILARDSSMKTNFPWFSSYEKDGSSFWKSDRSYIDIRYEAQLSNTFKLESRIFYDDFDEFELRRYSPLQAIERGSNTRDIDYSEKGYGAEVLLHHHMDDNSFLTGVYYDKRKFDKATIDDGVRNMSGINFWNNSEENRAIFLEDTYRGIDKWYFTAGVRFDNNNLRDDRTVTLPRFSTVYAPTDSWSLKYSYNTGYVRPFMNRDNVNLRSQESFSNDLELLYNSNGFQSSITFYRSEVDNIIVFDWESDAWKNSSAIKMRGIELEFNYKFNNSFSIYSNYAYANSKFEKLEEWSDLMDMNRRVAGVPHHTYNIGLNWDFITNTTLNLNLNGWANAVTRWDWGEENGFEKFGNEYFLDASLYLTNFYSIKDLSVNVYGKNLLNNDDPYPDAVEGGYIKGPHSEQIGLNIKYTF